MSLSITPWKDPYDAFFTPTRAKEVIFEPGLTVIVGCNGAGKTTLLRNIKSECEKHKIPVHSYDNLKNSSSNVFGM